MRTCSKCKQDKDESEFASSGKYLRSDCKPCGSAAAREWQRANPERTARNTREGNLRKLYGIGVRDYEAMLVVQCGMCAICGEANENGRRLAVDHCHQTGKIRQLLCENCNRALGMAKDNPVVLRRMADYLEENRCSR